MALKLETLRLGEMDNNVYIVHNGGEALVVDPGFEVKKIIKKLKEITNLFLRYILVTHAHFDHVVGIDQLKEEFPNANVIIGEDDFGLLKMLPGQGVYEKKIFHPVKSEIVAVSEGSVLPFADSIIKVFHTPGHTKGSVCYKLNKWLFTGDTLFYHTYGRIDLPYSIPSEMKESLEKIFLMDEDLKVLPGHGQETTIAEEKKYYS